VPKKKAKAKKKPAKKKGKAKKITAVAGVYEWKLAGTSGSITVVANSVKAAKALLRKVLKLKRLPKAGTVRRISALPKGCRLICK